MRRNTLGEARPETLEEIAELMAEQGLDPSDAQAEIFDCRDEPAPYTGWTAEISDSITGDNRICTCGFPDGAALMDGLTDIGITLFVEP